jgi:hypothetical protein
MLVGLIALSGCSLFKSNNINFPSQEGSGPPSPNPTSERKTIFGKEGITLFSSNNTKESGGIGVNSFLWRASLDTISFMPLISADPFGGVIITDWYQDTKITGERFKLTIYIMDRHLRADGVKVSVFRQRSDPKSGWINATVSSMTGSKIEDAILTRARQLRIRNEEGNRS